MVLVKVVQRKLSQEQAKTANLQPIDQTVCRSATTQIGSKSLWKKRVYGQFPARPFVDEAKRRGLTCGVGESGLSQVASTSYTPKPLEKSNWRPSEFEELVCELELAATGSYSKEDVISWLPQTSFHILAYDKAYSFYGEGSYKKRDETETIEYAENDDKGSWVTRFQVTLNL